MGRGRPKKIVDKQNSTEKEETLNESTPIESKLDKILDITINLNDRLSNMEKKVHIIEEKSLPQEDKFMAKEESKESKEENADVPVEIKEIVYQRLGKDFVIRYDYITREVKIVVPKRLSLLQTELVPKRKENAVHQSDYEKDEQGRIVMIEKVPEDNRVVVMENLDHLRRYVEKIRENIINSHLKVNSPQPVFKTL